MKFYYVMENTSNIRKINNLFLVTPCFSEVGRPVISVVPYAYGDIL